MRHVPPRLRLWLWLLLQLLRNPQLWLLGSELRLLVLELQRSSKLRQQLGSPELWLLEL